MSFDKFIQTRTIARKVVLPLVSFPTFNLDSFIDFEADGYLVGVHFMVTHNADALGASTGRTFHGGSGSSGQMEQMCPSSFATNLHFKTQ